MRRDKDTFVLGIHQSGPLSSAAIVRNGELVAGSPEERFSRIKHDHSFPHHAIDFCLDNCKIKLEDLTAIAFGWNPGENVSLRYRRGFSDWMRYPGEWLSIVPNHLLPLFNKEIHGTTSVFEDKLGSNVTIKYLDHHTCHARMSYETSGFNECAIMVVDGFSEQKVTSFYHAKDGQFRLIKAINFPQSIGSFYMTITDFLGYRPHRDEWKVMGMAAYGDKSRYPQVKKLIEISNSGNYELNLSYFDFYNFDRSGLFSKKMETLLGPPRRHGEELEQRHFDIAAAAQDLFERTMDSIISYLHDDTGCDNLVLSGGIGLNCLYNGSIVKRSGFSKCHISFAPDDSGNAIGAAFEVTAQMGIKVKAVGQSAFIGREFSDENTAQLLEKYKLRYRSSRKKTEETADLLSKNKIVGWFQGRSEFGQRALGHRSIFASPVKKEMKDILNNAVKYRESYRPFAPMLPIEKVKDYFETEDNDPVRYMQKAFKFRKECINSIPAVVHKDGTGRLQTIIREEEPLLHDLLLEFGKKSGSPVILNTSFNLNNEPIVDSPEDALRTFITSGIDTLIIGNFILEKEKILKNGIPLTRVQKIGSLDHELRTG